MIVLQPKGFWHVLLHSHNHRTRKAKEFGQGCKTKLLRESSRLCLPRRSLSRHARELIEATLEGWQFNDMRLRLHRTSLVERREIVKDVKGEINTPLLEELGPELRWRSLTSLLFFFQDGCLSYFSWLVSPR
jgi:hypothetical protein